MLVSDHLRPADGAAASPADQAQVLVLIESLLRGLRVQQEPAVEQQAILESAFSVLSIQTLAWVPHNPGAAVVVRGDNAGNALEYRQLADLLSVDPEVRPGGPHICNAGRAASWGPRFARVATLLAIPVPDPVLAGWLLAINKQAPEGAHTPTAGGPARPADADSADAAQALFRQEDIALLAPFAAVLELRLRGYHRYQDLKTLLVGLTRSLTSALDAKDVYTYGHSERVARIAVELGRELGLSDDDLSDLYLVGLLHDVGNLGIRDAILNKTDPLTAEEYDHIKQHVTLGYSILSDLHPIRHLLPGVLYHHENYDGSGYPDGLAGEAIPLIARILAVAEACDAMSNKRPYRDALAHRRVEEILVEGAGKQWDPSVIGAFMRCRHKVHTIRQRGVGPSLNMAFDRALRGEAPAKPRLFDLSPGAPPSGL